MSTAREEELLRRVEGIMAENQRDAARVAREDAERDERRAAAARSGTLGSDWQEVQRRIDSGQTSLAEVFSGADGTPAALRLRVQSRATIEALAAEFEPAQGLAEEIAAARSDLDRLEGAP